MLHNLRQLVRYRGLIQSLVARDVKARYRGSMLGFFWSFFNPLLLLVVYTFVFSVMQTGHPAGTEPYALFMFAGLLPWTWFGVSLTESANALIGGGGLIKKVLFPAEVLPIVTVLSNMVHFFLGLPILIVFLLVYRWSSIHFLLWLWFPVIVAVQLVLTVGLSLLLSALTVHFRDIRDILGNVLTLWFFATPIIYPMSMIPPSVQPYMKFNPFTHLAISYQEVLFYGGPFNHLRSLFLLAIASVLTFFVGYFLFDRLRDSFAEEV